ncbi:SDR family NAD(P)-dependent oxidoreductase [Mycobacterium kansasii]|uniref:SDR family NAD(P)-dependent oxidoreductase n=1 Tax=Mycobacterium kansasii TaxID=1768 RepID=UPI0030026B23
MARAFAREGARAFVTGRHLDGIDALANEIRAAGGAAQAAPVDALDERAVTNHLDAVVDTAGTIDISSTPSGFRNRACKGSRSPTWRGRASHCRSPPMRGRIL